MTAIIGINCRDGIVVGSDSSSTFATGRGATIEQPTKKLDVIADQVLFTGTGEVGLSQRFSEIVLAYWSAKTYAGKSAIQIGTDLTQQGLIDFGKTGARLGSFGALVAFPCGGSLHLCEFAVSDFQPEFKTHDKMWFVSMGGGQPITDPFLGLMRRVFWGRTPPLLVDGIFAAVWTLQHVIDLNPGGINGPAQIGVLDLKTQKAHILNDGELGEHIENAKAAEKYLAEYAEIMRGARPAAIPVAPTGGTA